MSVTCAVTRRVLPSRPDAAGLPRPVRRHVARCLRCQAEAAAYRGIRRDLGRLGTLTVSAPPNAIRSVAAAIATEESDRDRRSRWPVVAAATGAAVAAGGAVTAVVRHRSRLAG